MAHLMRVRFLPEPEVRVFTARTTAAAAAGKGAGDSKKADCKELETKVSSNTSICHCTKGDSRGIFKPTLFVS